MSSTDTAAEHNPAPEGTESLGGNDPLTPEEMAELAKAVLRQRGAVFVRPSKHRAGRTPKLTDGQRRRRDKDARVRLKARMHVFTEQQADARALLAALDD